METKHQIYLVSDSTGETLDRIFIALKAQFENFSYETQHFSFTRTGAQNSVSSLSVMLVLSMYCVSARCNNATDLERNTNLDPVTFEAASKFISFLVAPTSKCSLG